MQLLLQMKAYGFTSQELKLHGLRNVAISES